MIRINHLKRKRVVRRTKEQSDHAAEIQAQIEELEREQERHDRWMGYARLIHRLINVTIWFASIGGTAFFIYKIMVMFVGKR